MRLPVACSPRRLVDFESTVNHPAAWLGPTREAKYVTSKQPLGWMADGQSFREDLMERGK
jgi:hypothetical protein